MKFYDRTMEIQLLDTLAAQSERASSFTLMTGRRRIGKTALLLEAMKGKKYVYLFVSRKPEPLLCAQFQEEAARALGLRIFGSITRLRDLFEQFLRFGQTEQYTLIIDEFQEFEHVAPAFFSDIQDLWDRYKDTAKINFIVCGSIYSLLMKLFEDQKEPLFGRLTSKIILRPFKISVLKEILGDHNPVYTPEDVLCFYLITGGIPKYAALLMEAGAVTAKKMLDTVTRQDSWLFTEGKDLLISEFGREYGIYFSILQLIAAGKTSQSEIDSLIEKNTGAYLVNLEQKYSLIARNKPLFSRPESRNTKWKIIDNYLRFYFRFIYPNQALVEMGKYELLRVVIGQGYDQYSGLILENYFRDKLAEETDITTIGGWWDRKSENEIDIIALNDLTKTATVCEVKRNATRINLAQLAVKAEKLKAELSGYQVEFRGLSLADM
ncbi:MAG: ATP-binding protein [Treponema sp.]|jgi:AAA+ ATPase superfamily predicted ATPase|nr:ATP-binding protein [Treponema sp.]